MQEVLWEHIANGKYAQLKTPRTGLKKGGHALKELASSKMREVNIISADFQGTTLVFALLLEVFLDRGTTSEFLGVYQVSGPVDEEHVQMLPALCFKKSRWDKAKDDREFYQAESKKAYVEGEGQIDSHIVFVAEDAYPDISELMRKIQTLVYQGIKLTNAPSRELSWQEIHLGLRDDALLFALTYNSFAYTNSELERFIANLQKNFEQIDFTGGIIPDDGCFISYPLSVFERLNMFAE